MSLLDLEHVRSALEAEKKQWYVEGTKTWEQALIENNERKIQTGMEQRLS